MATTIMLEKGQKIRTVYRPFFMFTPKNWVSGEAYYKKFGIVWITKWRVITNNK